MDPRDPRVILGALDMRCEDWGILSRSATNPVAFSSIKASFSILYHLLPGELVGIKGIDPSAQAFACPHTCDYLAPPILLDSWFLCAAGLDVGSKVSLPLAEGR